MTGHNCDVIRYNAGASAAFLLAMAKGLRSVISTVLAEQVSYYLGCRVKLEVET